MNVVNHSPSIAATQPESPSPSSLKPSHPFLAHTSASKITPPPFRPSPSDIRTPALASTPLNPAHSVPIKSNSFYNSHAFTPAQPPRIPHAQSTGILSKRDSRKFHRPTPATPRFRPTSSTHSMPSSQFSPTGMPMFRRLPLARMPTNSTPLFAPPTSLRSGPESAGDLQQNICHTPLVRQSMSVLPVCPNLLTIEYFARAAACSAAACSSNQNTLSNQSSKTEMTHDHLPFSNLLPDSAPYLDSHYHICKSLGHSTFSLVSQVVHNKPDNTKCVYALKKITKPYTGPLNRERLLEEVWVWYILGSHPNVVHLECAWEQSGHLYMVMELCSGGTLGTLLRNRADSPLTEMEVWDILTDIALGLSWMHDRGVVHLDLKPDNVFLTHQGRCKLGDFGLSTLVSSPSPKEQSQALIEFGPLNWTVLAHGFSSTRPWDERVGDPTYTPEEAMKGVFGISNDVFAFGLVALEMITNSELPSSVDTEYYGPLRKGDISHFNDKFPESASSNLKNIIRQCLCPTPSLRPSMAEILSCEPFCSINTGARQQSMIDNQDCSLALSIATNNALSTPPPAVIVNNQFTTPTSDRTYVQKQQQYPLDVSSTNSFSTPPPVLDPNHLQRVQVRLQASITPSTGSPRTPRRLTSETISAASTGGATRRPTKRAMARAWSHQNISFSNKKGSRKPTRIPIAPIKFELDELLPRNLPLDHTFQSFGALSYSPASYFSGKSAKNSGSNSPSSAQSRQVMLSAKQNRSKSSLGSASSSNSFSPTNDGAVTPRRFSIVNPSSSVTCSNRSPLGNHSPLAMRTLTRTCGSGPPIRQMPLARNALPTVPQRAFMGKLNGDFDHTSPSTSSKSKSMFPVNGQSADYSDTMQECDADTVMEDVET